jgi:hypothetical protein
MRKKKLLGDEGGIFDSELARSPTYILNTHLQA